ncbi:MAG TPA: NAD-dependent epimerase/dehydratase family protein [Cyclobacteriaceae bacterium]|nr:NAD-dependent epimerase/dehydratase family protein [Cyclobacteriaceae bacterium]
MDVNEIYRRLLKPSDALLADIGKLDGDIIILGVGGKMGPALATLAKQAVDITGKKKNIIGVARFSEPSLQSELEQIGIKTYSADLLEDDQLDRLPDAPNVLYLAGMKFGTTGKESLTWAMNSYLPGRVAEKYRHSKIVAFSTGNVYPFTPLASGGPTEQHPVEPLGEYAQSCLGRERVFQYFSTKNHTPVLIYRLNYANDVSYGVLLDIARAVKERKPIDLRMGYVNIIWQGDANEMAIRALHHCSVPAKILNIAGPGICSVRSLAKEFGSLFKEEPRFVNEEQSTALLSNAEESYRLFGPPQVPLSDMIHLIARWVDDDRKTLHKPTHFQEREGNF